MMQGYTLTPQQARLWRIQVSTGGAPSAWCRFVVERVSPEQLRDAVAVLVERHEGLRTRFASRGTDLPAQVVEPGDRSSLHVSSEAIADHLAVTFSVPALCCDRIGLHVLAGELRVVLAKGAGALPPVAMHAADAAAFLEDYLQTDEASPGRRYWHARRLGPITSRMPWRPAGQVGPTARLTRALEVARIRGAQADRVELVDLVLAAWCVVVARIAGDAVPIGVRHDGRRYRELDGVVATLGRDLPLIAPAVPGESLTELARRVSTLRAEAEAYQDAFVWEDAWEGDVPANERYLPFGFHPCASATVVEDDGDAVDRHDVVLVLRTSATHPIGLTLEYDARRFAERDIAPVLDQLEALLTGAEPACSPMIGARAGALDDGRSALARIADRVATSPGAIALHHRGAAQSYREVWEAAARIASWLQGHGAGRGACVLVLANRTPQLVAAILGTWRAGCAYVPIDPADPRGRVHAIAGQLGPAAILTDRPAWFAADATPVLGLDDARREAAWVEPTVQLDDLAYVIYTSGSSGGPKGAAIAHRSLAAYTAWAISAYAIEPGAIALVHSSPAADLTLTSLIAPLTAGAIVELLDDEPGFVALARRLRGAGVVGLVKATPSHVEVLATLLAPEDVQATVRTIVLGGEPLRDVHLELCRARFPSARVINEYGPTEATVGCTAFEVCDRVGEGRTIPIGRAIAGTAVYLLDQDLRPAPTWVPGEIFIGGAGVARGYVGHAALTAERFVPDPFSTEVGARLYRTGDRARCLPGDDLEFLGRADDQLKIRGHRVEPGEVASTLRAHPAVESAIVAPSIEADGRSVLVAHLVLRAGATLDERALRAHLDERLPQYMSPMLRVHRRLPMTAGGKVDVRALAAMQPASIAAAPHSFHEELLAGIYAQVLGVPDVGIEDGFFVLGGDSIRAIQVVARARRRGLAVTLEQLFRCRTVRALAAELERDGARPDLARDLGPFGLLDDVDRARLPADAVDAYPLTALQTGMVYHVEAAPGTAIYHDVASYHLRDRFDAAAFEQAVSRLFARHAVLRTSFDLASGSQPLQIVHREVSPAMAIVDLRSLDRGRADEVVRAWIEVEKHRSFDIARAPLVQFQVHVRGDDEVQLGISFHHAILDGWSDATMLTELFLEYEALRRGAELATTTPRCAFRSFVALEREAVADHALWDAELAGVSPTLLPRWYGPRPVAGGRAVFSVPVAMAAEVSAGLRRLATALALPLKSVLLGVHMSVLSIVTGADDVVTCMSSSGRPEVDDGDRVLGLFLNSLPIRMRVGAVSWSALAEAALDVEQRTLPGRRHPFAEIVRRIGVSKLSDVAFYFTHYHVYDALRRAGGIEVLGFDVYEETSFAVVANFGLSPFTGLVYLSLTCDRQLVDPAQAAELAVAYERALAAAASRPWSIHCETDFVTPEARARALALVLPPAASSPSLEVLIATIATRGDAPAIAVLGAELSYAALWSRVAAIAGALRDRGIGVEASVALALAPGIDLIASMLGALVVGAAYVPIDPEQPIERVRSMLADIAPSVVIVAHGTAAAIAAATTAVQLPIEEVGEVHALPAAPIPGDALAYVLFTSGSTGRPRGVQVTRDGLARYLAAAVACYPVRHGLVPLLSTAGVDLGVTAMLATLVAGGTLAIVSDGTPGEALIAAFTGHPRYAMVKLTPSQARLVASLRGDATIRCDAVVFGGEALDAADVATWRKLAPGATLWNEYGPTETVVGCAVHRIEALHGAEVPIGRAFEHVELLVLDRRMHPVPTGVPGELFVGGGSLARGYTAADATADRFVPHPWSTQPGARLYRTGDIVRTCPDGTLVFVGRRDDQVKIRGHRVELGELEAALRACAGVRDAVATWVPTGDGGALHAFVVVASPGHLDVRALLNELEDRIPVHMLPATIVELPALPRAASGKADRRALPAPAPGAVMAHPYHPPRDPLEEVLATLWSELLGGRVGIHETFVELGGHSLVAVQLVGRIRAALVVDLPLRDLLDAPTIADLAAAIRRRGGSAATPLTRRIEPNPAMRFEPFPLTDVQHAYWIGRNAAFELGSVGSHLYMEVEGDLDVRRLEAALAALIGRHDMLRAIVRGDGQQVVLAQVPHYAIVIHDLRGRSASHVAAQLDAIRAARSHQVLDPGRWPVFEVTAVLIDDRTRVCFSMDALVADAWSMRLLARDLFRLYRGQPLGASPTLTFRDYVDGMAGAVGAELQQRSRAYWWSRIDDLAPAPELPLRSDAEELWRRPRFVRVGGRIEAAAWAQLTSRAARAGLTTTNVLMTAFAEALGLYARSRRFTLNLTLYNRLPLQPDVNEIVGDFTTLNLLEVDVRGSASFVERARAIQRRLWDDLDHRHVSGVEVLRELGRRRKTGLHAAMPVVFTSTLNLRELQGDDWVPDDLRSVYSLTQTPQVWLDHQVTEEAGELRVNWDVVEGLFPERMIDDLLDTYLAAVRRLCDDAAAWQRDLGAWLCERAGRRWDAAQTAIAPVAPARLESRFIEAAIHSPGAEALCADGRRMTYAELRAASEAVAAALRATQLGRGELVGIVANRGWQQAVGSIGVLAAGAAYVPVDLEWPERRRELVLARAGARVAVTAGPGVVLPAGVERIAVDSLAAQELREPHAGSPDDLAYVIFTSGSTGEPKGAQLTHRAAWNTIATVNRRWSVGPSDAVLAVSSLGFDLSVYDLFGLLAAGGRVVMPSPRKWRDPAHWAEMVARERVTIWNSVPSLMELLVDNAEATETGALRTLRLVLLSGDWVPLGLADRIRRLAGPGVRIVALGGATEAGIWSIAHEIDHVRPGWRSIPYGRALANQRIHVWDEDLRERAMWGAGELYIAGAGVAEGYAGDPARTAERFVIDPRTGGRLYRTGDFGRHTADGEIEFLGREDQQVKVSGHRIELAEIEVALRRCPGVQDAAVIARGPSGPGSKQLAAFVVPDLAVAATEDALRAGLRAMLPGYMVPATFQLVAALPLTANGKLDRSALAANRAAPPARDAASPSSPLERRVADAWRDVLGVDAVDLHDDFFESGGNSLRAIQLLTRLRRDLALELPIDRLLTAPSIAGLAAAIEHEVIDRLDQMSEEDAARMLASLTAKRP